MEIVFALAATVALIAWPVAVAAQESAVYEAERKAAHANGRAYVIDKPVMS